MRICFANILFSKKDERGGLGSYLADLSVELANRGHQVTVITSGPKTQYTDSGVRVIQLGEVRKFYRPWQLLNPIYLFQRLVYMARLARYVLRSEFDVVEVAEAGFEPLFLVGFRKSPLITRMHGNFRYIYGHQRLTFLMDQLERWMVRHSDGLSAPSLSYAATIAHEYNIPRERIKIIPYGIRMRPLLNLQKVDVAADHPQMNNKKIVLLSVGSSPHRKGATVLIEAAARLTQEPLLCLLLCSDQQFLDSVRVPDNVLVLGNVERAYFYSLLSASDVVVFPSTFESFSIATREAMLLNKIIVVSRHVPLDDVARDYPRAVVLPTLDPVELADTLRALIHDQMRFPDVDREWHQRLIAEYDLSRIADLTIDFYQQVVSQFPRRSTG